MNAKELLATENQIRLRSGLGWQGDDTAGQSEPTIAPKPRAASFLKHRIHPRLGECHRSELPLVESVTLLASRCKISQSSNRNCSSRARQTISRLDSRLEQRGNPFAIGLQGRVSPQVSGGARLRVVSDERQRIACHREPDSATIGTWLARR